MSAPVAPSGAAPVSAPVGAAPAPGRPPSSIESPPASNGASSSGAVAAKSAPAAATEAPAAEWGALVAVNRDGSDGGRFALSGDWVELGSKADLSFDDRYLARRHARFERDGAKVFLVPVDALNGTFLRLRDETELEDGDTLLCGREVLRFELTSARERDARNLVQHGVALFGSPVREAWGRLLQLLPSGAVRDVRHLSGAEVQIGREDGDLVFRDDEFLSRRHAAVRRQGDRIVLADLGSSNGTFLRVRDRSELTAGDHLRLGDQMFRFEG